MDEEEDLDTWPAFVDVLTAAVMFLVLGFVALTTERIRTNYLLRQQKIDRVRQDELDAATIGGGIRDELGEVLQSVDGAECKRERWEIVCTFKNHLTFAEADWTLRSEAARDLLDRFGKILKRHVDDHKLSKIVVEGHTDPKPMFHRGMTNWELSSARAGHIVRFLRDRAGIPGQSIEAIGLAEFRPPPGASSDEDKRFVAIRLHVDGSRLEREASPGN